MGWAVSPPRPTTLLGLVLCLGHTMHTQAGTPPDSVSPQGWPVTLVCRGPAGAEEFRLERKENRSDFKDKNTASPAGPHQTEARFIITAVSGDAARHYQCLYRKGSHWSEPSEPLELVVTGLPTEHVYILIGVPVAFLLCLLLLGLFLLHRQHKRKRGTPRSKGEEQRPQERLSPAVDVAGGTTDLATVDRLPEVDTSVALTLPYSTGHTDQPCFSVGGDYTTATQEAPAAGGPQEVIYAQLDHPALTQRGLTQSPLSTEHTAKSSMYAALARN